MIDGITQDNPSWEPSEDIPQKLREDMMEVMPEYLRFIMTIGLENLSQESAAAFFDRVLPEIEWETLMWQKTADGEGYAVGSITLLSLTENEGFQVVFYEDELQLFESNHSGINLMVFCRG